jgi:hypothetical protein
MSSTPYYNTSLKVSTEKIGDRTYRIGECHAGYFVRESETGARVDFYALASLEWFIAMLKQAAGDTDFDPTPTAPASVRLIQQSSVSALCIKQSISPAQDAPMNKEHTIRISAAPAKAVGEFYPDNFTLSALIGEFESKHGVIPTRIAFNDADDTYRFAEFAGIPVVKSRTVPSRQIHLMFDPAKAEAVQA